MHGLIDRAIEGVVCPRLGMDPYPGQVTYQLAGVALETLARGGLAAG